MVGFFDSGLGGLAVMRDFQNVLPGLDAVFYGDRTNCPYGDKNHEEIRDLTIRGVEVLVGKGAKIIILACNTAAAHAIRYLQNEIYPKGSGIQILGVTVPGAEITIEKGAKSIGVFATKATVASGVYTERLRLLDETVQVCEVALPGLVNAIENGKTEFDDIHPIIKDGIASLPEELDALVLGCTHYPLASKAIGTALQNRYKREIPIIDPAKVAAERFITYLERHPEFGVSFNGKTEIHWG